MKYKNFYTFLQSAVKRFRTLQSLSIRIVSHLDADGICSSAILLNALNNENLKYTLSIVKQLTEEVIVDLSKENYGLYFFTDLGTGQLDLLKKHLGSKIIYILDHHDFDAEFLKDLPENFTLINPHVYDIDGAHEVSGAGVVYLFSRELNHKNINTAHLAVIGAIGDLQENNGFTGLNQQILQDAIQENKITIEKGLRWFGVETRPLYKLLMYSTDPVLPGISGNESKSIQFLNDIGIPAQKGKVWTTFNDLNETERQKLISALVMKRKNEKNPEDILGNRYILSEELPSCPMRDAKEFSTLLNACGRMDRASVGIGACLADPKCKKQAMDVLIKYKKEIVTGLGWYENNKQSVLTGDNYIVINAEQNVIPTLIGTLTSIISKNENGNKFILGLAHNIDDTTKVSLRISNENSNIDLREIIGTIIKHLDGQSGGHKNAAGAVINSSQEHEFIEKAIEIFDKTKI